MTSSRPPVVVVGAGLAGLAAAVELSAQGIPVTVLEQRAHGGGRAYSFVDTPTGETIDNGQHVLIAGYQSTMQYLASIGTRELLLHQDRPRLTFHHPERGHCDLALPDLPSPFHFAAGMARTRLLEWHDKLRMLGVGRALWGKGEEGLSDVTVSAWLRGHDQSSEAIAAFWSPLCLAIMNESTERASALLFVRCLRRAFLEDPGNASLLLPKVGLSELLVHPALRLLRERGVDVRFVQRVTDVVAVRGTVKEVVTVGNVRIPASAVVLAIPPWGLAHVRIPQEAAPNLGAFQPSPIISTHLWFSSDFMEEEFLGVVGRTVQWVFNRRKIAEKGCDGGHLSCVISAASALDGESHAVVEDTIMEDLRAIFGNVVAKPVRIRTIREVRATFSPRPGLEPLRPHQQTSIQNLFLGGDWTKTGLPGTIEGAIWSGYQCAELAQAWFLRGSR